MAEDDVRLRGRAFARAQRVCAQYCEQHEEPRAPRVRAVTEREEGQDARGTTPNEPVEGDVRGFRAHRGPGSHGPGTRSRVVCVCVLDTQQRPFCQTVRGATTCLLSSPGSEAVQVPDSAFGSSPLIWGFAKPSEALSPGRSCPATVGAAAGVQSTSLTSRDNVLFAPESGARTAYSGVFRHDVRGF